MQPPTDDHRIARLAAFDACTVSDALDAVGVAGVLEGLRPMWEGARVTGRAVTVRLVPASEAPASSVHLGATAIYRAGPGDVIVVANEGRTQMGSWGGLLSLAATGKGIGGVIVDGACRDVDEARDLRFPVFARAGAVRTARGRVVEAATGEPVHIDGVGIEPGSAIVADGSGVVVVTESDLDDVLRVATEIVERERAIVAALRRGESLSSAFGRRYEAMIEELAVGRGGAA